MPILLPCPRFARGTGAALYVRHSRVGLTDSDPPRHNLVQTDRWHPLECFNERMQLLGRDDQRGVPRRRRVTNR